MSELGAVLSSTVLGVCPRELLGLTCLSDTDYECLCSEVVSASVRTEQDTKGAVLVLSLELFPGKEWEHLRKSVDLTGYKAAWRVSPPESMHHGTTVDFTFDLWRPQNADLKGYVLETGI